MLYLSLKQLYLFFLRADFLEIPPETPTRSLRDRTGSPLRHSKGDPETPTRGHPETPTRGRPDTLRTSSNDHMENKSMHDPDIKRKITWTGLLERVGK